MGHLIMIQQFLEMVRGPCLSLSHITLCPGVWYMGDKGPRRNWSPGRERFLKWLFIGPVLLLSHNQCYYYDEGLLRNVVPPEGASLPQLCGIPKYTAKKIPFDTNKKATGVLVDTEGNEYILSATKEVILTAGVFGSPQLLLVSGVGPAATFHRRLARSGSKHAGSYIFQALPPA